MKISVIIPVYNAENFLSKCVNSVLNQSFYDFELILINDGSTDNSGIICDKLKLIDDRVYVIHQENKGVSAARNNGLNLARGEWVYFVDSDDTIEPGSFDVFFNNDKLSNIDIIQFGLNRIYQNGNIIVSKPHKEIVYNDIDDYYRQSKFIRYTLCINFFRRLIISENQLRFSENIKYAEDGEFYAKFILLSKKIMTLNYAFYNYNIHDDSVMNKDVSISSILDHSVVLYNMVDFIIQNKEKIKSKLYLKEIIFYFLKSFLSRISLQSDWLININIYQKKYRLMFLKAKIVLNSEINIMFFIINRISIIPYILTAKIINNRNKLIIKSKCKIKKCK